MSAEMISVVVWAVVTVGLLVFAWFGRYEYPPGLSDWLRDRHR